MTQARVDLYDQGIFEGNRDYNWGDIGATYIVDPCNGIGGQSGINVMDGFYQTNFWPRFIKETSERAYYDFFVREDIKIDLLFIDGDHSYEGVKKDFELYSKLLSPSGIISIHDTDKSFEKDLIVTDEIKTKELGSPLQLVEDFRKR